MAANTKAIGRVAAARPRKAATGGVLGRVARWLAVSDERRRLARADDRMLKDIGVSRADAQAEAARPFWDLPNGR